MARDRLCRRASVLWTRILTNLKAAQDIHMDVAERSPQGQKLQLGYGKHPPLSGWIAGAWFRGFSGYQLGDLCAGDGGRPARGW